jgi:predicted PurR-regulated permease PerM
MIPFLILVAVVASVGIFFFQVIRPMLIPLFLAGTLAMLCQPLLHKFTEWFNGHSRIASMAVVILIVLLILGPLISGVYAGIAQLSIAIDALQQQLAGKDIKPMLDPNQNPTLAGWLDQLNDYVPVEMEQIRASALQVAKGLGQAVYLRTMDLLGDLPGVVVGIFMFLIALYYFLADGSAIMQGWNELTPLDPDHDRVIREEFTKVCRGVVWATIVASVAQGILLAVGLSALNLFFGLELGKWILLLSLITMVFAMVPFVGAASVWVPTMLYLGFQGEYIAAGILLVYGTVVVSSADNLIKVFVLQDSASLHPLLVFVCVFGGIHLVGILGIFIGPIVGAVLFALMRILRTELTKFDHPRADTIAGNKGTSESIAPRTAV